MTVNILDSLTLSASTNSPVSTSFSSFLGEPYIVTLSGTAQIPYTADGLFYRRSGRWIRKRRVSLDGVNLLAPEIPFNSNHVYHLVVTGTGNPFTFRFEDSGYGDNSGTLTVTVREYDPSHEDAYCPISYIGRPTSSNPIDLKTGDKQETLTDLSLNTPVGDLSFTRFYRQEKQDILTQPLGLGWTHNHISTLDSSVSDEITVKMPNGAIAYFIEKSSGIYVGDVGSSSVMTIDSSSVDERYTLIASDKSLYIYSSDNKLRYRRWPDGKAWQYRYYQSVDATKDCYTTDVNTAGELCDVRDGRWDEDSETFDPSSRKLVFQYNTDGLLYRVGDQSLENPQIPLSDRRYVQFEYFTEKTNGQSVSPIRYLLRTVRDIRGEEWTYNYYGQVVGETDTDLLNHMLSYQSPDVDQDGDHIKDGTIQLKLLNYQYDSNGNLIRLDQSLGNNLKSVTYLFQSSQTIEQLAGLDLTHRFMGGVYLGQTNSAGESSEQEPNGTFRPGIQRDPNHHETKMVWSADGKHLLKIEDAESNITSFTYDSEDRLETTVDAEGRATVYRYNSVNSPRQPTEIEVVAPNGVDTLRWQQFTYDTLGHTVEERWLDPADPTGITLLQRTTQTYGTSGYENGRLTSVVTHDLVDPSNNTSVTYTYDAVGRVIRTHTSSLYGTCKYNFTIYDPAGNVRVTACSAHDVTGDVTAANIDALRTSYPEETTVTTYQYDALGRRVRTTTDDGAPYARTHITLYDGLDRVIRTVHHYVNPDNGGTPTYAAPGRWVFENGVWKDGVGGTEISHGVDGDENIVARTAYNARGQVRLTQDVFGVVTLYGYDPADRLVKTVTNASDPIYDNDYVTGDPDLSGYVVGGSADQDIVTEQAYDPAGNLVRTVDARGAVTFTVYDPLNRPVKVVRNARDTATVTPNNGDPGYDAANDPRSDSYAISSDPERDQIEITKYDKLGRVIQTNRLLENRFGVDAWETTLYGYDSLGRQVRSIRVAATPDYDIAADPDLSNYPTSTDPDTDVVTDTVYDAQDRVRYTVGPNDIETWNVYDGLGRTVRTVQNPTESAAVIEDMTTDYVGDLTDPAADIVAETTYDADGRVQTVRRVLRTNDAGTALEWVTTLYGYDSLGRQVRTIQNATNPGYFDAYADPDLGGYETNVGLSSADDEDILTETVYDERGRVYQSIDRVGNVILYGYDESGRRVKTVMNASNASGTFADDLSDYTGSSPSADQDRISSTEYGLGGRVISTTATDGTVTRNVYDAIGRRVRTIANYVAQGATDPADWTWSDANMQYEDGAGNPIDHGADFDQNRISDTVYNKAGQVTATRDPRGTVTAMTYDNAGRRLNMTAASGTSLARQSYTAYDKAGRVLRTITNWIDSGTSPDAIDGNGDWLFDPSTHGTDNDENLITTFTYDRASRRTMVTDPVGNITTTAYRKDGVVTDMTDPESTVTAYRYDALNRRQRVVAGYVAQATDPSEWVWNETNDQWEDN